MKISVNIKPIVIQNTSKEILIADFEKTLGVSRINGEGEWFRDVDGKLEIFGVIFHKQRVKAQTRRFNRWTAQLYKIDESMLVNGIRITQHSRHFEIKSVN